MAEIIKLDVEAIAKAVELTRQGMSAVAVARETGVSADRIRRRIIAEAKHQERIANRPNWFRRLLLGDPDKLRRWLG